MSVKNAVADAHMSAKNVMPRLARFTASTIVAALIAIVPAGPVTASGLSNELKDDLSRAFVEAGHLTRTANYDEALQVLDQVIEKERDAIAVRGRELDAAFSAEDELTLELLDDVLEYDYYVSAILGLKCQLEIALLDSRYTYNQAWCRDNLLSFVFGEYANLIGLGLVKQDPDESRTAYVATIGAKNNAFEALKSKIDEREAWDFFRRWNDRTHADHMLAMRWVTGSREGAFVIESHSLGSSKDAYEDAEDRECLSLVRLMSTASNLRNHRRKFFLADDSFDLARDCRSQYWRRGYTEQFQTGLLLESLLRVDSLNDGSGMVGFEELPHVLKVLRIRNHESVPLFDINSQTCSELAPVAGGGGVRLKDFWQSGFLTDTERTCLQQSLESAAECEAIDAFACYLRRYAIWPGVGVD